MRFTATYCACGHATWHHAATNGFCYWCECDQVTTVYTMDDTETYEESEDTWS